MDVGWARILIITRYWYNTQHHQGPTGDTADCQSWIVAPPKSCVLFHSGGVCDGVENNGLRNQKKKSPSPLEPVVSFWSMLIRIDYRLLCRIQSPSQTKVWPGERHRDKRTRSRRRRHWDRHNCTGELPAVHCNDAVLSNNTCRMPFRTSVFVGSLQHDLYRVSGY